MFDFLFPKRKREIEQLTQEAEWAKNYAADTEKHAKALEKELKKLTSENSKLRTLLDAYEKRMSMEFNNLMHYDGTAKGQVDIDEH